MKYVSTLWRGVWSASVSFFTPVPATSHRRQRNVTTISSYWFCLKGALAQPSNSARGPRATHIYLPANPVERSFAFQSIHKNTTRLWSWKSVHSSPATFKVAFKEDKHHGLPSHRNTGVFRARRSHQRHWSPAQVGETLQDAQANQTKAGGQPHQGGLRTVGHTW